LPRNRLGGFRSRKRRARGRRSAVSDIWRLNKTQRHLLSRPPTTNEERTRLGPAGCWADDASSTRRHA
jgi:hypothetical protein